MIIHLSINKHGHTIFVIK